MTDKIKQAETYPVMIAVCPHCEDQQEVEWIEEYDDGLEQHTCTACKELFTYCHYQNAYGLAI